MYLLVLTIWQPKFARKRTQSRKNTMCSFHAHIFRVFNHECSMLFSVVNNKYLIYSFCMFLFLSLFFYLCRSADNKSKEIFVKQTTFALVLIKDQIIMFSMDCEWKRKGAANVILFSWYLSIKFHECAIRKNNNQTHTIWIVSV